MTNRRSLTMRTPLDLLALIPCVLGFHPEDSVVLLTVGTADDRSQAGPHARVDLPSDPEGLATLSQELVHLARRTRARRAALVVYTTDGALAEAAQGRLRAALEQAGVEVVVSLRADGERWFSLDCSDTCCPPEGTPYDLSTHPLTAESVLDGRVTYASRRALADSLVGTDLAEVETVGEAADEAMCRFRLASGQPDGPAWPQPDRPPSDSDPATARGHLVAEGHWVVQRVRRFLGDGAPLAAEEVGRLLVAMVAIEVRDAAWAEMTQENAGRHVELWRDVVRRAPHDLLAAPAALLGFAAWLSGDGALAWCAVERCQEAEPDYRLAGLLAQALAGAVPPSSWRPPDAGLLPLFAG